MTEAARIESILNGVRVNIVLIEELRGGGYRVAVDSESMDMFSIVNILLRAGYECRNRSDARGAYLHVQRATRHHMEPTETERIFRVIAILIVVFIVWHAL